MKYREKSGETLTTQYCYQQKLGEDGIRRVLLSK